MEQFQDQITDLLKVAMDAARQSGQFLAHCSSGSRVVEIDSCRDVKVRADKQSEQIILNVLKTRSNFSVLTEERGLVNGVEAYKEEAPIWVVDPLDGSVNFSRWFPLSCTSVGLWQGNKPILGAVYDFHRDEMFSGITSGVACLNDKPIVVSHIKVREDAILCTGFPVHRDFSSEALMDFVRQVRDYKKVRLMGSAALSLAYVACGRADAYMEDDIMLWDVAGGLPIVMGAGGQVYFWSGREANACSVRASNSELGKLQRQDRDAITFGV